MRLLPDQASNFAREVDYIFYVILGLSIFFSVGVVVASAIMLTAAQSRPGDP